MFFQTGAEMNFSIFFEEIGYCFINERIFNLVPFILEQERMYFKHSIKSLILNVIFDGVSNNGETLAVLAHFVNNLWIFQHKLLAKLSKTLTRGEVAHKLILSIQWFPSDHFNAVIYV